MCTSESGSCSWATRGRERRKEAQDERRRTGAARTERVRGRSARTGTSEETDRRRVSAEQAVQARAVLAEASEEGEEARAASCSLRERASLRDEQDAECNGASYKQVRQQGVDECVRAREQAGRRGLEPIKVPNTECPPPP